MNKVDSIKGLQPKAQVALSNEITAPIQEVEVTKTIDYKNNPKPGKSEWQGYMVKFSETSAGVPKVVPVDAGQLLSLQTETGVQMFEETEEGHELINFNMGINENGLFIG